jgi:hypothetical protein
MVLDYVEFIKVAASELLSERCRFSFRKLSDLVKQSDALDVHSITIELEKTGTEIQLVV